MTATTMRGFRCWTSESIGQTVFSDIGALASDADALFLAAHTPVQLDHRKGPEIRSDVSGEQLVLDALLGGLGDSERNTLIAVTGGSGAGKSHVVRWVNSHVDRNDERLHVLYVPRAVQTIRELLRRIIEGLPGDGGAELLGRVEQAFAGVSEGQLQDQVVSAMAIALRWQVDSHPPVDGETDDEAEAREERNNLLGDVDADGRRRDGLADLLSEPLIEKALLRKDGNLSSLVASYFRETSRRDVEDNIFSREDLPLRERGVRGALKSRPGLLDLWELVVHSPDAALSLMEDALRIAAPTVLGLKAEGGETLDALFRTARKALREQGKELMLIFEDLAQFGLVEVELYEQFILQPGDDLAPLRAVFAVTDGAFGKMEKTVGTRVNHVFHVGGSVLERPAEFVGRYLNLARIGRDRAQELWDQRDQGEAVWMENACDTREEGLPCRVRETCHASFGRADIEGLGGVGLYPFNPSALRRALRHIEDEMTPRSVMEHCLITITQESGPHIDIGDYPHARVIDLVDKRATLPKEVLLNRAPSTDPERMYRALLIWGDEESLRPGIAEAFALEGSGSAATVAEEEDDKRSGETDVSATAPKTVSARAVVPVAERSRSVPVW